jgi:hypothetical protein
LRGRGKITYLIDEQRRRPLHRTLDQGTQVQLTSGTRTPEGEERLRGPRRFVDEARKELFTSPRLPHDHEREVARGGGPSFVEQRAHLVPADHVRWPWESAGRRGPSVDLVIHERPDAGPDELEDGIADSDFIEVFEDGLTYGASPVERAVSAVEVRDRPTVGMSRETRVNSRYRMLGKAEGSSRRLSPHEHDAVLECISVGK